MAESTTNKRKRAPVDVFRYRDYREFLAAFYATRKKSGMSYRRFSAEAGLGAPNYLKLVIDGKRNLSRSMAVRFASACKLSADSAEYFLLLVALNQASNDDERNELHSALSRFARFRQAQGLELAEKDYHSTWYIPALRELVACSGFQEDAAWIACNMRPPISEKQAAQALETLLRLGLLQRDAAGRLQQASRTVSTGAQASGLYIRNYHTEMMQRASVAMQEIPASERLMTSLTLGVSPETLLEVERRAHEFRSEILALCDADLQPSRVVQFNFQLYPLTEDTSLLDAASEQTDLK